MRFSRFLFRLLLYINGLLFLSGSVVAAQVNVAVASNFKSTLSVLADQFERETTHKVRISAASTGKLYAQIKQGAPFDVFLAADSVRPVLLERQGLIVKDSRFTYARGKVVLWSANKNVVPDGCDTIRQHRFKYLALANPKLSPYGVAAFEVISACAAEQVLQTRIVQGENISQAYQFVASGNAELGFVALSQVVAMGHVRASYWLVPDSLYTSIDQQWVLLQDSPKNRLFLQFMQSKTALAIMHDHGYDTP